jgi:hypothetical protein
MSMYLLYPAFNACDLTMTLCRHGAILQLCSWFVRHVHIELVA